ncbi:MAG: uroporphyrinogen decarboxylase family protein [Actinomycetota bacterium]
MNATQWMTLKKCAAMESLDHIPVGLIVDSPWIPGYIGITTMDYFTLPEKWFKANLQIKKDFPEMIFIPDFWVEYGMAAEPSGFGCRINFFEKSTPTVNHIFSSADDLVNIGKIKTPNPKTDGLMPFILNLYKYIEPKVKEIGESIKIVAARGPLTIASHLMGLTEFLIGLKIDPGNTHKLLEITAKVAKDWLEAQADALSEIDGIIVLDDVVGFLSKEDYLEFAHPYFKDIFKSFSTSLKIYHNDTDNTAYYEFLEDMGINIFNFTGKQDISKVREMVGNKICLMGNVPPLEVLTQGSPETVITKTQECLNMYNSKAGILLSAGGGASPGTPGDNIRAMIEGVKNISVG